jgi:UDP-glucose 4-epimerase
MNNLEVIVTGGCGYIGSHVARLFKQNGYTVHIIDRVYRPHTTKGLDGFICNDFVSPVGLSAIKNINPDVIVHCAGTSLVGPSMTDPGEYYDNNIVKTITMLNVIKDMDKKPTILFSSSAAVYGDPDTVPIDEDHKLNPISPYGNTKRIIETIFKDYAMAYGINSVCFRYFNAAGAEPFNYDLGQEPNATHIVARVLESKINGTPFTLNGTDYPTEDGTCIRDYIHVWDLATAHLNAVDYVQNNPGAHIFNLGTNTGTSNQEIVTYVTEKYGLKSVKYGDRRPGDPAKLVAYARLANTKLNWYPEYSNLPTIVDSAYKWYCQNN